MVTAPPDLSIFQEPNLILAQMTPTWEGPGALIRPSTPKKQPAPWGHLVLYPSKALSGLVLEIKGPSPEGKRQFRTEFINQASPVV